MKKNRIVYIVVFAVILVLAISIGVITYAAYTHSLHTQRTIAPYDSSEKFSSNVLKSGDVENNVRTIYVAEITETSPNPSAIITVCNYPQGRQTLVSANDITYTFKIEFGELVNDSFEVVTSSALSGYSASINSNTLSIAGSRLNDSLSSTLTGDEISSDVYTLTLSKNFASEKPNLYVLVSAIPNDNSYSTLKAVFKADVRIDSATDQWMGSFIEDNVLNPSDYDGYNYVISGFGSGTFTLSWDNSKLNISYISLNELLGLDNADYVEDNQNHVSTISFSVDSDISSRYEIQFYKINITSETWTQMSSEVVIQSFR